MIGVIESMCQNSLFGDHMMIGTIVVSSSCLMCGPGVARTPKNAYGRRHCGVKEVGENLLHYLAIPNKRTIKFLRAAAAAQEEAKLFLRSFWHFLLGLHFSHFSFDDRWLLQRQTTAAPCHRRSGSSVGWYTEMEADLVYGDAGRCRERTIAGSEVQSSMSPSCQRPCRQSVRGVWRPRIVPYRDRAEWQNSTSPI
jgi:hypothetical protein